MADIFSWHTLLVCGVVMVNPLFWNGVGRLEYKTRVVSKVFGGPKRGIIALAAGTLSLNYMRTAVFHKTVDAHGPWAPLNHEPVFYLGTFLVLAGTVFVIASFWKLGFYCCFLGDYFGILLSKRVTGFPFNVVDDPMYWGSVVTHVGLSLRHASPVGLLLTGCIGVSYALAVYYLEEPFTAKIYADKQQRARHAS